MKEIKQQSQFCLELMKRLNTDIDKVPKEVKKFYHVDNRTRIQNDIIRLRRELMDLSKMFNWDSDCWKEK